MHPYVDTGAYERRGEGGPTIFFIAQSMAKIGHGYKALHIGHDLEGMVK